MRNHLEPPVFKLDQRKEFDVDGKGDGGGCHEPDLVALPPNGPCSKDTVNFYLPARCRIENRALMGSQPQQFLDHRIPSADAEAILGLTRMLSIDAEDLPSIGRPKQFGHADANV